MAIVGRLLPADMTDVRGPIGGIEDGDRKPNGRRLTSSDMMLVNRRQGAKRSNAITGQVLR